MKERNLSPEHKEQIVKFILDNLPVFRELAVLAGADGSTRKAPRETIDRKESSRRMRGSIRK